MFDFFNVCVCLCRLLEQVPGSGEGSEELTTGGSQEKDEFEQMFPKVSVKPTGAVIPLNKGSERQTHLEQRSPNCLLKPTHKATLIECSSKIY